MRLLILGCTATKRPDAGGLPAIDRYQGPSFRTLRAALRTQPAPQQPTIWVLSARYGLISAATPIPDYDERLTPQRAGALLPAVHAALRRGLAQHAAVATCLHLGPAYQALLPTDPALVAALGVVTTTRGGIGQRLHQLRAWLHAASPDEEPPCPPPTPTTTWPRP